jgi:hypothetical protein
MVKKSTECSNYNIAAVRNAYNSLNQIEEEIHSKIIEAAKAKLEGNHIDVASLTGSFRVYEIIRDRFDESVNSYTRHQDNHLCEIPADLEEIF